MNSASCARFVDWCFPSAEQRKHILTEVPGREGGWREEGQKEKPADQRQKDGFSTGLPGWGHRRWDQISNHLHVRSDWIHLLWHKRLHHVTWLSEIMFLPQVLAWLLSTNELLLFAEHSSKKQEREVRTVPFHPQLLISCLKMLPSGGFVWV